MRRSLVLCAFQVALAAWAPPAPAADGLAVARAVASDGTESKGVVFFVPARSRAGVAAIGTAHNANLSALVSSRAVEFQTGEGKRAVARSVGFLVTPGRAFNEPGGSLAGDFVAFALEERPAGVAVLEAKAVDPRPGERVELVGIPRGRPGDEDRVSGRVVAASSSRIEVDLDAPYDLRGWGGAPVLDREGRAIGMLQAHWPKGDTSRVLVAPIRELLHALGNPLEGGAGRPFAAFGGAWVGDADVAPEPPSRQADSRRAARAGAKPPPQAPRDGLLIHQGRKERTRVHLDVEYPADGAVVSDSICGAFISGRAMALQGELRRFDVMLVVDTSRSTVEATGADINGNNVVGKARLGRIGSMFDMGSTDPGDSILAAEVAAARQLLRGLDPRSTRVGVVTFAGIPPGGGGGGLFVRRTPPPAETLQALTGDYARVEAALDEIAAQDPAGSTHMAAGVDQATIELLGLQGGLSQPDPESEKVVFFFTDGQPTLPYGPTFEADNVRAVLRAASRASRGSIRIHSFAIGPDALEGPIATVEMASRTNGYFTPVRHPGDLVDIVEEVSFANLEDVSVKSLTTGEAANPFRATADGSWGGFVKMVPGENRIQIQAKADDGTQAQRVLKVTFEEQAPSPEIPTELVVQRNRLLEDCLRNIKRVRMEAEKEHAEDVRKQLLVEIEKERAKARSRADEQRKNLELEVENAP